MMTAFHDGILRCQCRSKPFSIGEPDSAILCKLVCTALKAFGDQLLQDENAVRDIYTDRLKSVAMCMDILSRCLRGDFFNVGMLLAYQDTIAVDLIRMYLHIIAVKMPLNEIIVSPSCCLSTSLVDLFNSSTKTSRESILNSWEFCLSTTLRWWR